MASTTPFLTAIALRHSIYALAKESPIPNTRILEIVTEALKHAPSPFNVRSTRCIVLFGDEHNKLWEHTYQVTERDSPQAMGILGPKIKGLGGAYATILFFDDATAYTLLPPRFRALSLAFSEWEEHSSGMNQFIVWTALAAEGMGANLQHYQPGITPYVREKYDVPAEWTLKAQLVCGMPVGEQAVVDAKGKAKTGLEGAVRVFGA